MSFVPTSSAQGILRGLTPCKYNDTSGNAVVTHDCPPFPSETSKANFGTYIFAVISEDIVKPFIITVEKGGPGTVSVDLPYEIGSASGWNHVTSHIGSVRFGGSVNVAANFLNSSTSLSHFNLNLLSYAQSDPDVGFSANVVFKIELEWWDAVAIRGTSCPFSATSADPKVLSPCIIVSWGQTGVLNASATNGPRGNGQGLSSAISNFMLSAEIPCQNQTGCYRAVALPESDSIDCSVSCTNSLPISPAGTHVTGLQIHNGDTLVVREQEIATLSAGGEFPVPSATASMLLDPSLNVTSSNPNVSIGPWASSMAKGCTTSKTNIQTTTLSSPNMTLWTGSSHQDCAYQSLTPTGNLSNTSSETSSSSELPAVPEPTTNTTLLVIVVVVIVGLVVAGGLIAVRGKNRPKN
ncbi:MAG: hypothetical protein ACHQ1H_02915 [Nitrososphaerales archaeon]